ncbi:MAG: ABC transporter ATP-binding protein [Chitinophagaceae bacterium]
MISINNISKTYNKGTVQALKDISLNVNEGEIVGLIGPDGAGKSTLFRILTTLLLPDTGQASVSNFDVVTQFKEIRKHVGYMPGKFSLYLDLTVEENLNFFATVFNTSIQSNYHLIKDIYQQLEPFKNRKAGKLSGGMKQKLALCCALIHKPLALFLDEPTTGVDVVSRKEFWTMLKNLQKQGLTILVSTPYMDEASLCDQVAFMQNGTILSKNKPQQFIEQYTQNLYGVNGADAYKTLLKLRAHPLTASCFAFGNNIHITLKEDSTVSDIESQFLDDESFTIQKITPTLEDCFIQLLNTNEWKPS